MGATMGGREHREHREGKGNDADLQRKCARPIHGQFLATADISARSGIKENDANPPTTPFRLHSAHRETEATRLKTSSACTTTWISKTDIPGNRNLNVNDIGNLVAPRHAVLPHGHCAAAACATSRRQRTMVRRRHLPHTRHLQHYTIHSATPTKPFLSTRSPLARWHNPSITADP
ncbi:hypothetical protein Hypma_013577 [Hypsizygus marmoreus]|uniref:Uncharacterized protein n=1 Tax=Hypsizygus marmoreus TaxID=39966 RepID=A0A369JAU6_HYPMA|nr:hypothetical protein Hypma_013577 [Hypsizygus marmoreus]